MDFGNIMNGAGDLISSFEGRGGDHQKLTERMRLRDYAVAIALGVSAAAELNDADAPPRLNPVYEIPRQAAATALAGRNIASTMPESPIVEQPTVQSQAYEAREAVSNPGSVALNGISAPEPLSVDSGVYSDAGQAQPNTAGGARVDNLMAEIYALHDAQREQQNSNPSKLGLAA